MNNRFLVALLPALMSWAGSCGRVENTFTVRDPAGSIIGAELALCGGRSALRDNGEWLSLSTRLGCEGSGEIVVRLSDGRVASCRIGYVTPGLRQEFEFVVQANRCEPVPRPAK
jgi:hypothetical protein